MNNFSESSPGTGHMMIHMHGLVRHARELVRHRNELQRATGEHFNLFQILGVGHYEVSTHSALLCDLLDPNGSHGQGAIFLKYFITTLNIDGPFDVESAKVQPEVSIGTRTEGGRLDILITDRNDRQIAIENKIHAGEQKNWVSRYRNGLRPDAHLIYLTLDGSDPTQLDKSQKDTVLCISYANSILKWLEFCRKEASSVPIVRESLTQYIHLIQHLTHQNTSSRMNDEIVNSVLQNAQDFDAYCALRDADSDIKRSIINELAARMRRSLPDGFEMEPSLPDGEKHNGFVFSTPVLTSHNLKAVISFDSARYGECFYGFEVLDLAKPARAEVGQILVKHFTNKFLKCSSSPRWPAWSYWTQRKNWSDDVFRLIKFGETAFDDEINAKMHDLFDAAYAFADEIAASNVHSSTNP